MIFRDRQEAGRLLAERLAGRGLEQAVVLALPRGGVPVAFEVARRLGAEMDVLVVRKLGAPGYPEYAVGAIAEGGATYVNREALRELGLRDAEVAALAEREAEELARRVHLYRGSRALPDLRGRTVLVVDDGVATGATARAAARAARQKGAARVILAAPVVAAASEPDLRADFDEVLAVELPPSFFAVGAWYQRFDQVSDDEVLEVLGRAHPARAGSGEIWNGEWMGPDPSSDLPLPSAPRRGEGRGEGRTDEVVEIPLAPPAGHGGLEAFLAVPPRPAGLVLFVHGSGSTRRSPRNRFVAEMLGEVGLATLLFDLLTADEAEADEFTGRLRFEVGLLTRRVIAATHFVAGRPDVGALPLGYFGASTGAAAALAAAAALPARVAAVVSRGGRPDLVAPAVLAEVRAPVLLLVGGHDEAVLGMNRAAAAHLRDVEISVVPGATHLFEERGALETVARRAADFFVRHLAGEAHAPGAGRA